MVLDGSAEKTLCPDLSVIALAAAFAVLIGRSDRSSYRQLTILEQAECNRT